MPSLIYFVHDLWDPAVARRTRMFRLGGAQVHLAGFRRREPACEAIGDTGALDLGLVGDGALAARAAIILKKALSARQWGRALPKADVIVARSLELLTLAWAYRLLTRSRARLVYECLDIHRVMFSQGLAGRIMRLWERFLLRRSGLVITSSPAFAQSYFAAIQKRRRGVVLVENKLAPGVSAPEAAHPPPNSPPWRIGWFGMIRCAKSLDVLRAVCAAAAGRVEVIIAGRVSYGEFEDFHAQVDCSPYIRFLGPYEPEDLARLYGQTHFVWAIDYFEEGQNSAWLLPNRIYEGSAYGSVPLALASVETGRWLMRQNAGVALPDDLVPALDDFFSNLTSNDYAELARHVARIPRERLVTTRDDCEALVRVIGASHRNGAGL